METLKLTLIDTGGHGYLSVSKKVFKKYADPNKVTGYSGHNFSRIYLEEDCDAIYFIDQLKKHGVDYKIKCGYNLSFSITHNYNPEMFDYTPKVGDVLSLYGYDEGARIVKLTNKGVPIIECGDGNKYHIPKSNPHRYIKGLVSTSKAHV